MEFLGCDILYRIMSLSSWEIKAEVFMNKRHDVYNLIFKWFGKKLMCGKRKEKAYVAICLQLANLGEEYMGIHCTVLPTFLWDWKFSK